METAFELAACVAGDEQRRAAMVVDVRVGHRRAVEDEAVREQVAVAVGCVLQLLEQIGNHAHVIPVDLRELEDALLALAVMRRVVEAGRHAALRIRAARRVASELQ